MDEFQQELKTLVNRHSLENASNTPDFLLAEFLVNCLRAFNLASEQKEKWFAKEVIEDDMSASEAVYGFAGWLTSRSERVVMSSKDDAAAVADLVAEFCRVNDLAEPREGWTDNLVHPTRAG